jgi:ATP-dependent Clp protease ATP-binding subunit ClpC
LRQLPSQAAWEPLGNVRVPCHLANPRLDYHWPTMFERYTERARRVFFFTRYEASELGSRSIETEHVLLGLLREGKGLTSAIFERLRVPLGSIHTDIAGRTTFREKLPTSIEIPFSAATIRVLQFAAEEADRFKDQHIGSEHLLLGLLREETCVAASILATHGQNLDMVRTEILSLRREPT